MKTITDLLVLKKDLTEKKTALKKDIYTREVLAYNKYITDGGNARTAKDKVIGEIKSALKEDDAWLLAEKELEDKSNKLVFVDNVNSYAKILLESIDIKDVTQFITACLLAGKVNE